MDFCPDPSSLFPNVTPMSYLYIQHKTIFSLYLLSKHINSNTQPGVSLEMFVSSPHILSQHSQNSMACIVLLTPFIAAVIKSQGHSNPDPKQQSKESPSRAHLFSVVCFLKPIISVKIMMYLFSANLEEDA